MQFAKYHGLGNDFIIFDCVTSIPSFPFPSIELKGEGHEGGCDSKGISMGCWVRQLCHRHTAIGADGVVLLLPPATSSLSPSPPLLSPFLPPSCRPFPSFLTSMGGIVCCSMRVWNADGQEAEMCGNAIRCVAKYIFDRGIFRLLPKLSSYMSDFGDTLRNGGGETKSDGMKERDEEGGKDIIDVEEFEMVVFTLAGAMLTSYDRITSQVSVHMGHPRLCASDIPTSLSSDSDRVIDHEFLLPSPLSPSSFGIDRLLVTCVSMGNPHCVLFLPPQSDLEVFPVRQIGPLIECDTHFPRKTNVEFIQVITPNKMRMRVWERGCGVTQACGTGACAAVVAGVLTGRCEKKCEVSLTFGSLFIEWTEDGEVVMRGPAAHAYDGTWGCDRSWQSLLKS
jgi:diaminopimelate epimerase